MNVFIELSVLWDYASFSKTFAVRVSSREMHSGGSVGEQIADSGGGRTWFVIFAPIWKESGHPR